MNRVPDLREVPDLPDEVVQAALDGELVLFVGAGVSMLLGLPSWGGMAKQQLTYLRQVGALNDLAIRQLGALDPKTQLSIASQIAEDKEIRLDLTTGLTGVSEGNSIYKSINDIGCVCVTTNYDELLEPRYTNAENGSETPALVKRICRKNEFLVRHLDTPGTVIHLHGAITDPKTMIVTTRDYLTHYDDRFVQTFLSDLFLRKTVLFIGYGLAEKEILEHILRRGRVSDNKERKRFVLQGYCLRQKPLYEYLHHYYRKDCGVHVIGFVRDYQNYKQQKAIFDDWGSKIVVKPPPLAETIKLMNECSEMDEMTPKALSILESIKTDVALRRFFFRKAKGLQWFDALDKQNYFNPDDNPAPVPAKEEGYFIVPFWDVTDYLVATSSELLAEENRAYAERVLDIIRVVTQRAKEQEFGNWRTWWQFSKIIQNIPLDLITSEVLDYADYWLDDQYQQTLAARELGKWLVALLKQGSDEASPIALELLKILYKASVSSKTLEGYKHQEAVFRFDKWHAEKITTAVAGLSGKVLGKPAVQIFEAELQRMLKAIGNDSWSSLWRAAIEDPSQNHSTDHVENILVASLRDSLGAWVGEASEESIAAYVAELLQSPLQVLKRIAIYTIGQHYQHLGGLIDSVVTKDHFGAAVHHEMWCLLRDQYPLFPSRVKQRVQKIIGQLAEHDEEGNKLNAKATAYIRAIWFAAIKHHEDKLQAQYEKKVEQAGAEPDHPEFLSYWSSEPVVHETPKTSAELLAMNSDALVEFLNKFLKEYEDSGHFQGPSLKGLVKALKAAVKAASLEFSSRLDKFSGLDSAYVHVLIEAFSELWTEKKTLPWDDIWQNLLHFCEKVIQPEAFWSLENSGQGRHFVGNRSRVVDSIGRLIEAGTQSDEHAFSPELLDQAKELLLTLLKNEPGKEFAPDSGGAVSIAINSPRGHCLKALINLALRSCRLADKKGDEHMSAWNNLQPIFDEELAKPDEFEFITLLVFYLPNFLYMSMEWVSDNLARIFDRENYQKWLCAMQAYAYVNTVYNDIYNHLKTNDHFIDALDDKNLKSRVSEKIIQNIVSAYLNGYEGEDLENDGSLIQALFDRPRNDELSQIIWFIWTIRQKGDKKHYDKVIELWRCLLQAINTDSQEGRKLASRLTIWAVFITKIDDTNRDLILQIAKYAEEGYNSHVLLELIARISAAQPEEAVTIWQELLKGAAPDYPEEAIREAFSNLIKTGNDGKRDAVSIADEYIRHGNEKPNRWLQEILSKLKDA